MKQTLLITGFGESKSRNVTTLIGDTKRDAIASYLAIPGKTGNEIYLCKLQPQTQTASLLSKSY